MLSDFCTMEGNTGYCEEWLLAKLDSITVEGARGWYTNGARRDEVSGKERV